MIDVGEDERVRRRVRDIKWYRHVDEWVMIVDRQVGDIW
jgi:hypothetical protein